MACTVATAGTITGATNSGLPTSTCGGTTDDDTWFSFTATSGAEVKFENDKTDPEIKILGVDENFERTTSALSFDVVHGDVDRVVACLPLELVGEARKNRIALERPRHVDDVTSPGRGELAALDRLQRSRCGR